MVEVDGITALNNNLTSFTISVGLVYKITPCLLKFSSTSNQQFNARHMHYSNEEYMYRVYLKG